MQDKNKILITGANGFLGTHLCSILNKHKQVIAVTRKALKANLYKNIIVPDLNNTDDCPEIFEGVGVVIHCAARAHIMNDEVENPISEYRKVNTLGTKALALAAEKSGVKRFIFISSIKVNGEKTFNGNSFKASDLVSPVDPYAISKYEAENDLLEIAKKSDMEVVIIRPPLVYGPGVKANFEKLMKVARLPIPMPFSSIKTNKRSLVSLDNLCNLIKLCITHPKAANRVFLVSDDEDLSTAELFNALKISMGKKIGYIKFPLSLFSFLLKIIGKQDVLTRLIESLQLDITDTKTTLGWTPPYSVSDSIKKTTDYYLKNK